jgi:hypothetical protein
MSKNRRTRKAGRGCSRHDPDYWNNHAQVPRTARARPAHKRSWASTRALRDSGRRTAARTYNRRNNRSRSAAPAWNPVTVWYYVTIWCELSDFNDQMSSYRTIW